MDARRPYEHGTFRVDGKSTQCNVQRVLKVYNPGMKPAVRCAVVDAERERR